MALMLRRRNIQLLLFLRVDCCCCFFITTVVGVLDVCRAVCYFNRAVNSGWAVLFSFHDKNAFKCEFIRILALDVTYLMLLLIYSYAGWYCHFPTVVVDVVVVFFFFSAQFSCFFCSASCAIGFYVCTIVLANCFNSRKTSIRLKKIKRTSGNIASLCTAQKETFRSFSSLASHMLCWLGAFFPLLSNFVPFFFRCWFVCSRFKLCAFLRIGLPHQRRYACGIRIIHCSHLNQYVHIL